MSQRHRESIQVLPRRTFVFKGQNFCSTCKPSEMNRGSLRIGKKDKYFFLFFDYFCFHCCKDSIYKTSCTGCSQFVRVFVIPQRLDYNLNDIKGHQTNILSSISLFVSGEDL